MSFPAKRAIGNSSPEGTPNDRESGVHLRREEDEIETDQDILAKAQTEIRHTLTGHRTGITVTSDGSADHLKYVQLSFTIPFNHPYALSLRENLEKISDQYGLIWNETPLTKITVVEVSGWMTAPMRQYFERIQDYLANTR